MGNIHFILDDGTQGQMTEEEARRNNIRAYQPKQDAQTSPNHRTSMQAGGRGLASLRKYQKMSRPGRRDE